MDKHDLRAFWDAVWPFVPPSIGAYFGLRQSVERTKKEQAVTWFCSAFLSLFLGQAIGEYWSLGRASTSGVSIIIAMCLSDLTAVLVSAMRQLASDPAGVFRRWLDALLGRGGSS